MALEKVKDYTHLRKDSANGGIINVDNDAYLAYKRQKSLLTDSIKERESMKSEINSMKKDLEEIKNLLHKIVR
jgi:hypothetical protein